MTESNLPGIQLAEDCISTFTLRYLVSPLAGNPTSEIMRMFATFMLEPP
jgi:hypothetical protein